jgi:hypothetical protein
MGPLKKIWDWSGDVTTKSDAATRMAVYEDVLKKTGNEAEAIFQALEVINFGRRGGSALAKILTAATPFLNAKIQGLDLLYRAGRGRYSADMKASPAMVAIGLFQRMGLLMATTLAYYAMVRDEDEYKNAAPEIRDNNWILPIFGKRKGAVKIPIPFEVGLLAKVIPERIIDYFAGGRDGRESFDSIRRAVVETLEFNPIWGVQAWKPAIEIMTNHSFWTGRPLIPFYQENIKPELQYGNRTSEFAKVIGDLGNASPIHIEHLIKGYGGTLGAYGLFVADMITEKFAGEGNVERPARRVSEMPMIRRFWIDELDQGNLHRYYDLRRSVESAVSTSNRLLMQPEERAEHVRENIGLIRMKDAVNALGRRQRAIKDRMKEIVLSSLPADEKTRRLDELLKAQQILMRNVPELRNIADMPIKVAPFPFSLMNR